MLEHAGSCRPSLPHHPMTLQRHRIHIRFLANILCRNLSFVRQPQSKHGAEPAVLAPQFRFLNWSSDVSCHLQLLVAPVAHPRPANPLFRPRLVDEICALTARLLPLIPSLSLTPFTIFSRLVSTTTPPTTISLNTACSVSNPKIRSSSHTFSNNLSKASTKT